ncbi:MAG: hypothetical protein ACP5O0_04410 [Acidimicrobiales bacterium]|jgi:hypothetical protein
MDGLSAELSSMEYTINELAKRASGLGDQLMTEKNEILATELYQVEKALLTAVRRIAKLHQQL